MKFFSEYQPEKTDGFEILLDFRPLPHLPTALHFRYLYLLISVKLVLLFISVLRKIMMEQMLPINPHNPINGISTARVTNVKIGYLLVNSVSRNILGT